MTDFSIDQTPNTPQGPQATGDSQQPVQQKGTNPKDIKIFDFGGDNNHNAIVDADDFDNPETLKMYQDKGLIGKPWVMIKEKLGELYDEKEFNKNFMSRGWCRLETLEELNLNHISPPSK